MSIEEDIRKIAGDDQSEAAFKTFARMFTVFFHELKAGGLTRSEATQLTSEAVAAMFTETFRKTA